MSSIQNDASDKEIRINSSSKRIEDIFHILKNKVDKIKFEDETINIWTNFENYCGYKHLDEFKSKLNVRINNWILRVGQCEHTWEQNKEIIRRFDEILCTKAPKFAIDDLK